MCILDSNIHHAKCDQPVMFEHAPICFFVTQLFPEEESTLDMYKKLAIDTPFTLSPIKNTSKMFQNHLANVLL